MKFGEALEQMKLGKKVYNPCWGCERVWPCAYIFIKDGCIHTEDGRDFSGKISVLRDDWEIYVEPRKYLTTKEAMQELLKGSCLGLNNSDSKVCFDSGGNLVDQNNVSVGIQFAVNVTKYNSFYKV